MKPFVSTKSTITAIIVVLVCATLASAQSFEPICDAATATMVGTQDNDRVHIRVVASVQPRTNSLTLHVQSNDAQNTLRTRARARVPSTLISFTGGQYIYEATWVFGTALGSADDVSFDEAAYILGRRNDSHVRLYASYRTDAGCDVASGHSAVLNLREIPPVTLTPPVLSTHLSSGIIRDNDEYVVRAELQHVPTKTVNVYALPRTHLAGATSPFCGRITGIETVSLHVASATVVGFASMRIGVSSCYCIEAQTQRAFCEQGTVDIVADVVASLNALTKANVNSSIVESLVWSSYSSYAVTFSSASSGAAVPIDAPPVLTEPMCQFDTPRWAFRRGDTVRIRCDFFEFPTVITVRAEVGANRVQYNLGSMFHSRMSTRADGTWRVAGRRTWRRELVWVVGATLTPTEGVTLARIHELAAMQPTSATVSFLVAYNFHLGTYRGRLFYHATTPVPLPVAVTSSTPAGSPVTLTLLPELSPGEHAGAPVRSPTVCTVVLTSPDGAPVARANDVVRTRIVCDARSAKVSVLLATLASGASTIAACASAASDAAIFPTFTTTLGTLDIEYTFSFTVRGGGVFGATSCVAAIDGSLQAIATIVTSAGTSAATMGSFPILGARARNSFTAQSLVSTPGIATSTVFSLTGRLAAAQTTMSLILKPAATCNGCAGPVPAPGAQYVASIAAPLASELDTFSRQYTRAQLASMFPLVSIASSRPYSVLVRTGDTFVVSDAVVSSSFTFAPLADVPVTMPTVDTPFLTIHVPDDVATATYSIRSASGAVLVPPTAAPASAHTVVIAEAVATTRLQLAQYYSPEAMASALTSWFALPIASRPFAINAANIRVALGLDAKPRQRVVEYTYVSPDGARAGANISYVTTFADTDVMGVPEAVVIASPVRNSKWIGAVPFVVGYKAAQSASTTHSLSIHRHGTVVPVATLVSRVPVAAFATGGAFAFDLRMDNITGDGTWAAAPGTTIPALEPGAYNFFISASTAGGNVYTASVINVEVDAATEAPANASVAVVSLSGEIRDRAILRVAFTPVENYDRVDLVCVRARTDVSIPLGRTPADELVRIPLAPTSPGLFVKNARTTSNIVVTDPMVRALTPGGTVQLVELYLESTDSGGNPPSRVGLATDPSTLGPTEVSTYTWLARRDVVDFGSSVAMAARIFNAGVAAPRTARVSLSTNFEISALRMELTPLEPIVPAHLPGTDSATGIATPIVRVFDLIPGPPSASGGFSISLDLNLEATQTSPSIAPQTPSLVGVIDGRYAVRFRITPTGGGAAYWVAHTREFLVDTRTLKPSVSECTFVRAPGDETEALVTDASLLARDIVACKVTVPESMAESWYELVDADASGLNTGATATLVTASVPTRVGTLVSAPFAWRVGTLLGNATGVAPLNMTLERRAHAHGLVNARVSIRMGARDTSGNRVSYSDPTPVFRLSAQSENILIQVASLNASMASFARLSVIMEDTSTAEIVATPVGGGTAVQVAIARTSTAHLPMSEHPAPGVQVGPIFIAPLPMVRAVVFIASPAASSFVQSSLSFTALPNKELFTLSDGSYTVHIVSQGAARALASAVVVSPVHEGAMREI